MARESRLPVGGENLFQGIKRKCDEAEAAGQKLYKLSIGQPTGPALLSAREAAAKAIMSDMESMHEYQDNGEVGVPGFSKKFAQANIGDYNMSQHKDIEYLPIAGIKSILGMIPMACGGFGADDVNVETSPGYPVAATWSDYLGLTNNAFDLSPDNSFLLDAGLIKVGTDLIMFNFPHNPSGQISIRKFWTDVCRVCEEHGIRVFNDAAYAMLAHDEQACTLSEVAVNYPDLSWAEAFSCSKVIANGTGWRVGAMAGSPDFIANIATIKGNTDSGFNAALATGVLHAVENDRKSIQKISNTYKIRSELLIDMLTERGMQLAVEPKAGFFTLWKLPKKAFGKVVVDAESFNFEMIKKTGLVGVHFPGYIRYAVVPSFERDPDFLIAIEDAFDMAKVEY